LDKDFIRRFIKDTALTSIGTGTCVVLQFLSVILLSRYLSKEGLGLYFLVLAITHVLTVLSGLGLDITQVRILSMTEEREKVPHYGRIVFSRTFMPGALGILLAVWGEGLFNRINPHLADYLMLIIGIFVLGNLRNLFYHTIQGFRLFTHFAVIQSSTALVRLLLIIILIFAGNVTVGNVLWIELAVPGIGMLATWLFIPFRRLSYGLRGKTEWAGLFRFSTPIYMNNILTVIIDRANVLLMGILMSLQGVAIYEVAAKIHEGLMRIFRGFIVVYFPNISMLLSGPGKKEAENLLNQSMGLLSAGAGFMIFCIFLFRKDIMVLMFSETYITAAMPMFLMMIDFYLRAMSNILGYSVVSAGYSTVPVMANVISSTVLVTGSILLIPRLGVYGAIISLFLMNITTQVVYSLVLTRAGIGVKVLDYLKPLLLVLAAAGAYLYIDREELLFRGLFLVLYSGLSWILIEHWRLLVRSVSDWSLKFIGFRKIREAEA
jgi:O-antigen/teichoic acid export membrane protein